MVYANQNEDGWHVVDTDGIVPDADGHLLCDECAEEGGAA